MKEFMALTTNLGFFERSSGKIGAIVELIFVTSEPTYSVDVAGDLLRHRAIHEYRFHAVAPQLKKLAAAFADLAKTAEEAEKRAEQLTDPAEVAA